MTYAKIIAHSRTPEGAEVVTMEVEIHRFVLAEFNTHRVFSRNSASSRAIPFGKMMKRVMDRPALPLSWPSEKPGMQGGDELSADDTMSCQDAWLHARDNAVRMANLMHEYGLHKSVCNRLLEPFMWHTVIVTSTEWGNFFEQRCSPLAQPEIRAAAEAMHAALADSEPHDLEPDGWHAPYLQPGEIFGSLGEMLKVSAARCARVSYLNHDGQRSLEDDLQLFDKLQTQKHWSPLEHVCVSNGFDPFLSRFGNLRGYLQLRHILEMDLRPPSPYNELPEAL